MFKTMQNALKTPDVRKKLLYTLLLIVIFRLGCYITVPGVNAFKLAETFEGQTGLASMIDLISGGAFTRFSIFAMSITPYITAQIVIQLLAMIIPSLEKLTKEGGEEGRQKISFYTKILAIVLSFVESLGIYLSYRSTPGLFVDSWMTPIIVIGSFIAGTAILMWLGEEISSKGIGNGISVIIFVVIIAGLPQAVTSIWTGLVMANGTFSTTGLLGALGILVLAILLVTAVVFIQSGERRIPVQYSKKVVGRKMVGAQNTNIPLKVAMAGVMPIIFASSFMTFPAMIIQIIDKDIASHTGFWNVIYNLSLATSSTQPGVGYAIANAIIYLLLIVGFTFFYTYATFNPAEVSANIRKNGGFIPGIRAGSPTTEYLKGVISKLTIFGGLFLAVIAILPMALRFVPNVDLTFGGTAILIVVGVALETVDQLESQLVMRHYKGFLR